MRTVASPLAPLFRSDAQARVLTALFLPVEHQVNLAELAEQTGVPYGSVHREVGRLVDAGILTEERLGNARYVRPNQASVLWRPLHDLVTAAFGLVPLLRAAFAGVPGVGALVLFGSYAARLEGRVGPPPGDVDVLVIGQPDAAAVYDLCEQVAREVGRPVNPTILTTEEWQEASSFAVTVADGAVIPIIGDLPAREPA
jgi:DNA-binding transcriptional ArsR family regulator